MTKKAKDTPPELTPKTFSFLHIDTFKASLIAAGVAVALSLLQATSWGNFLEIFVARRLEFTIRGLVGRNPPLDPRIKIFAVDDRTVTFLKSPDLSYPAWGLILKMFSDMKPRAIFIDKIFGLFDGDDKGASDFIATISAGTPVFVGRFFAENKIAGREELPLEQYGKNIKDLYKSRSASNSESDPIDLPWLETKKGFIYGPALPIIKAFKGVGHINYLGDGYIEPLIRVRPDLVLPHMTLSIADDLFIDQAGVFANGKKLHLDRKNRLLVNLIFSPESYKRVYSLREIIRNALNGLPPNKQYVQEGDVAVILPAMFTGNADMASTPIGRVPGGFVIVSMINSVLHGEWLEPIDVGLPVIWVCAFLGMLVGTFTGISGFWFCLLGVPLLFITIGTFAFVSFCYVIPWFFGGTSMLLTGLFIFAERFRLAEWKLLFLKRSLQKAVTPEKLEQIIRDPKTFKAKASETVVTLMNVQIIGFSQMTEQQTPDENFALLRKLHEECAAIVTSHGGVIDQSLSVNFLCYFSREKHESQSSLTSEQSSHADRALTCAVELQKARLKSCLSHHAEGKPVFPIRIGINSAYIHIGGLGEGQSLDFVVMGQGVEYVKRLEAACEPFKIMISPTTQAVLSQAKSLLEQAQVVYLRMSDEEEASEVFELDPLKSSEKEVQEALKAYREYAGIQRIEPRWPIPAEKTVSVRTDFGQGYLVDFSLSGLSVSLKCYCAKGMEISLAFDPGTAIQTALQNEGLAKIHCEVRWGRKLGDRFLHGLLIKNLSEQKKKAMSLLLREHILK